MAKVLVRVRPDNTYKVSRTESYSAGEECEVDDKELKALPHCLVSVAEDDAAKQEVLQKANDQALASSAIFHEAREAAIKASQALREAHKIAGERRDERKSDAEQRVAQEIEKARAAPAPKIAKPKHDKKPDLA